jgi:two-component system chemotaxis sensor kinase CheA
MEEVLDEFIVETTELLEEVNEDLVQLEANPEEETINRIFRAFHTFKGTCGFLGFTQAKDLAHVAEDLLNQIRNGKLEPSTAIIDNLLASSDWFTVFVEDVKGRQEKVYDIESLINRLEASKNGETIADDSGPSEADGTMEEPAEEASLDVEEAPMVVDSEPAAAEPVPETNGDTSHYDETTIDTGLLDAVSEFETAFASENNQILLGNAGEFGERLEKISAIVHRQSVENIVGLVDRAHDYLVAVDDCKVNETSEGNVAVVQLIQWLKECMADMAPGTIKDGSNLPLLETFTKLIRGESISTAEDDKSVAKDKDTKQDKSAQTIRVDMERLENLMNLAGELVLNRNQLGQAYTTMAMARTADTSLDNLDQVNNSLGRITTEIQEAVMQMRMLPISNVFRKYPRVVRDLAKNRKKDVELVLIGEETELDRSVIEAIKDPLLHLVRNAVDHGVEDPAVRKAKGKPVIGTVILSAAHEGNHIVIEVQDDGGGMDANVLVKKAVEKGVITQTEAESMSMRDKLNLIFRPGFSTAAKVTDVSGRGVGMDVVHTNISKLNGVIDLETKIGEGSKVTIKLPLTLAIVTGLKVEVWDEEYIVPFGSIIETIKLDESELTKVEDKWVIRFRDSVINTLYLDDWFGAEKQEQGEDQELYAVIVAVAEFRYALVVTGLKGQEEAVIKPLGQVLGRIPGIAGGTIGGDGRITLILDIPELVQSMGLG